MTTKYYSDITEGDKETVIQMYKDAKVEPEINHETIQAIIKETDIWVHSVRMILKDAGIYVPSPIPSYQDLETATRNFKPNDRSRRDDFSIVLLGD